MKKQGIWSQLVENLPINPLNKMEDLMWQMDAEVLKTMGADAFVKRMNSWGPTMAMTLFNNGYKKLYSLSNDQDMDYGIKETRLTQIGAFDCWNACKVRIPDTFADDDDRLSFVKVLRMTHSYMDAVEINDKLLPTESDHQAAVTMACLLYNTLLQDSVIKNKNKLSLKGKSDEGDARTLAGLKPDGKNYSINEWGRQVVALARKYKETGKLIDSRSLGCRQRREGRS